MAPSYSHHSVSPAARRPVTGTTTSGLALYPRIALAVPAMFGRLIAQAARVGNGKLVRNGSMPRSVAQPGARGAARILAMVCGTAAPIRI